MNKAVINQTIYRNVTYLYMHVCKYHTCHGIRITAYMFYITSINSNFNTNCNFTIVSTTVRNNSTLNLFIRLCSEQKYFCQKFLQTLFKWVKHFFCTQQRINICDWDYIAKLDQYSHRKTGILSLRQDSCFSELYLGMWATNILLIGNHLFVLLNSHRHDSYTESTISLRLTVINMIVTSHSYMPFPFATEPLFQ